MQANFPLVLITIIIGGLSGLLIAHHTRTELKTAVKYLRLIQPAILTAIALILAIRSNTLFASVLLIVLISTLALNKEVCNFMLLGIMTAIAPEALLVWTAPMAFAYFLMSSTSLYYHTLSFDKSRIVMVKGLFTQYFLFLVIALIAKYL